MNGKEYLAFTKKERNGVLALAIILIAVILLPRLFQKFDKNGAEPVPTEHGQPQGKIAKTETYETVENMADHPPGEVSPSDGNTRTYPSYFNKKQQRGTTYKFKKSVDTIEVNSADTSQLIALPFIGSKLASRIVLFRNKLGGFVSIEQLKEVYGIHDSVFHLLRPRLKCNPNLVRKIPVNTADRELLRSHPYIRWQNANSLVTYRENHGSFNSMNDLRRIHNIDTTIFEKLEPYLVFN